MHTFPHINIKLHTSAFQNKPPMRDQSDVYSGPNGEVINMSVVRSVVGEAKSRHHNQGLTARGESCDSWNTNRYTRMRIKIEIIDSPSKQETR